MSTAPVAETAASSPPVARPGLGPRRATLIAVALLTILGAVLRFWRLGHQSFWYDEAATLSLVHHSFGGMLSLVHHTEGTPPLYFSLARLWTRVFGYGEVGLRSLSAVVGVASIPLMYAAGARLISRRAGLVAAALTACNPFLIWYSQEARAYSLLVFTLALSLLAFAHLLSPRLSGRWLVCWALAAMLALATHYFAFLLVVPEAIWLLWLHRRRPTMWLALYAVGAVGALLVWFAIGQKSQDAYWIPDEPLGFRLGQMSVQFLLGTGAPIRTWLKVAGLVALILAAIALFTRADQHERRGALRVGILAGSAFVLSLLLVVAGLDRVLSRNLIAVLLAVILLVATGLGLRRARVLGLTGTAILCAIGITATVAVAVDENFQRPPWRQVAAVLRSGRPAGTASAIVVENNDSLIPISDYVPGLRVLFFGAPVRELDLVSAVKAPTVTFCWWGATCSLPLAPLDTSLHLPGFSPAGPVTKVDQFSIYRLRAAKPTVLTPQEIGRALSSAKLRSYGLFVDPAG